MGRGSSGARSSKTASAGKAAKGLVDRASGIALSGGAEAASVLKTLDQLQKADPNGTVAIADIRDRSSLSRAAFDRAVDSLRRDWIVSASPAEGRHEVAKRLLDGGIADAAKERSHGVAGRLSYLARRDYD